MFIVKADNPDVGYGFTATVTDSEDHPITNAAQLAALVTEFTSDNPDIVSLTPDPVVPNTGIAHFGTVGVCALNLVVKKADGTILGSGSAGVTVVEGDPAKVTNLAIGLSGLVEEPVVPPPPVEPPAEPPVDPNASPRGSRR